eukprot:6162154-Prymnesium_polylepis.1
MQRGLRRLVTAFHLRDEWLSPETVARDAGWPQMARQVRRAAIRTRALDRSPAASFSLMCGKPFLVSSSLISFCGAEQHTAVGRCAADHAMVAWC